MNAVHETFQQELISTENTLRMNHKFGKLTIKVRVESISQNGPRAKVYEFQTMRF